MEQYKSTGRYQPARTVEHTQESVNHRGLAVLVEHQAEEIQRLNRRLRTMEVELANLRAFINNNLRR